MNSCFVEYESECESKNNVLFCFATEGLVDAPPHFTTRVQVVLQVLSMHAALVSRPTTVETSLAKDCLMLVFEEIDGGNMLMSFLHYRWQEEGKNETLSISERNNNLVLGIK